MRVIGIIGGVACGKSVVAGLFRKLGASLLSGDQTGHEVLLEADVRAAIRQQWGDAVCDPSGEIDRAAVARLVFAPTPLGQQRRAWLEQLTHPRIGQRLEAQLQTLRAQGADVVVLDAPVLLKAGWDRYCDAIVFVEAPREVRLARARGRGWSETDFAQREAAQEPLEAKRARADLVIDNSASLEQTRRQVDEAWRKWHEPVSA